MLDEVRGQRLIALFLLGFLLLSFPLLQLVDGLELPAGLPMTVVYLFVVWALIVALVWRIGGRRDRG